MKQLIAYLLKRLTGKAISQMEIHMEQHRPGEHGKVSMPKYAAILGAICFVIFLIFTVIVFCTELSPWMTLLPIGLALVSALFIPLYINYRITYDNNGFTFRNLFRITHTFAYEDVTAIRENYYESFLYMGKHRISVDRYAVGGQEFLILVKQRYSMLHPGQTLPKVPPSKFDPFKGHISDVGAVLFGIAVGTIFVGLALFGLLNSLFATSSPDNTVKQSVCFKSWYAAENEFGMYSTDNQLYVIRHYGEPFNEAAMKTICNGIATVTTYSKEINAKVREDHYVLKAVELGGTYLLSFKEADDLNRSEFWPAIFFVALLALGWIGFIAGVFIVGRNPKKYSQRTVRFFFNKVRIEY